MELIELLYGFIELSLEGKLFFAFVVIILGVLQYLTTIKSIKVFFVGFILVHIAFYWFIGYVNYYSVALHLFYFIPSVFVTAAIYVLVPKKEKKKVNTDSPWCIRFITRGGKNLIIENIKRGLAVFGSAGAGKTESVFVPIIKNAAKYNITGINYDYKDGELTEIINYFYQNSDVQTYNIIPHKPELSCRINPIHPSYIDTPEMVNELVNVLFSNMKKKGDGDKGFFREVPEATLAAAIWRLKKDYPQYCTLPHAISVCLVKSAEELSEFLSKNTQSRLLAAPFFDSLKATEQMAGIKASMSNDLRKFSYPSIYYILSGNEVDLHVNNPDTPGLLNLINSPGNEITLSPFLALIFTITIKLMQQREMRDSYIMMDEAATMYLPTFARIPATMRSYNIATIFSLQDKVLGTEQYGEVVTRSILSNLSYQIIGKTNDPESVKYYKQISEEIEKKQFSKSYNIGSISDLNSRKTISTRDTSKYKNQDFFGLKAGEFIAFSDGVDRKVNFDLVPFERVTMKVRNHITQKDLEDNYNKILKEASELE